MANIVYSDIVTDLKDRINHLAGAQVITKEQRNLLYSPKRIARAITDARIELVLSIPSDAIPGLITTSTPTADNTFQNVDAYNFPADMFSEREDMGIVIVTVGGTVKQWHEMITLKETIHRANSDFYSDDYSCFAADKNTRQLYAPTNASFSLKYVQRPGPLTSASTDIQIDEAFHNNIVEIALSLMIDQPQTQVREQNNG